MSAGCLLSSCHLDADTAVGRSSPAVAGRLCCSGPVMERTQHVPQLLVITVQLFLGSPGLSWG